MTVLSSTKKTTAILRRAELASRRNNVKTILIAGGAGFLGSHLCKKMIHEGNVVLCADNFMSGREVNIVGLKENPRFFSFAHDIVDPLSIPGPVDEIYNLACPASPPLYQRDPVFTMKTNVIGLLNLLELAKEKGARLLQSSTSEVYGDPDVHPQPECYRGNVNTFGPRACYDEGKRAAETLCHDFAERHGVTVKIARIFNTYGPQMRADDGRVVSNFINQALQGENITIYGTGKQTRSFCYVDDMIDGLTRLMHSSVTCSEPINIGNPGEFTVRELAEMVIENTGSKSKVSNHALPIDDPKRRRPDISMAKQVLDWEPKVSLTEGLSKTIQYFATQLQNKNPSIAEVA